MPFCSILAVYEYYCFVFSHIIYLYVLCSLHMLYVSFSLPSFVEYACFYACVYRCVCIQSISVSVVCCLSMCLSC